MSKPKGPAHVFIDPSFKKTDVVCDPKLLTDALQYRIDNQLLKPEDFYRNISVWKLVHRDGSVQYHTRANDSHAGGVTQVLEQRVNKIILDNPGADKKKLAALISEMKKELKGDKTPSGIHSEVNVVADITRNPEVRQGVIHIAQVFTERTPCFGCRAFITNQFPAVLPAPFFYYIPFSEPALRLAARPFGGDYMLFLLDRYGVAPA